MGRVRACPHRRRGSELHILLEMGSSAVVKMRQNRIFLEIAARMGGFFFERVCDSPREFLSFLCLGFLDGDVFFDLAVSAELVETFVKLREVNFDTQIVYARRVFRN